LLIWIAVLSPSGLTGVTRVSIVAVALSHVAHFLSVLALYRLSVNIFGQKTATQRLICFLSAALHIICPAGAFLSAPYGESLFSFLNITGFYVYSSSLLDDSAGRKVTSAAKLLIASVLFSIATTIRSNGILSGFAFACDAVLLFQRILLQGPSKDTCIRLSVTIIGGCVLVLGMIMPQAIAYADFCLDLPTPRPWCGNLIPSIYGWVQSHYWSVKERLPR
jgi:phosphatidylinositol glycan class V